MSDWGGTTERVAVEVMLADGLTLRGDVHVQARVAHRDGPETPLELLNREEPFFSLVLEEGGVAFVSKAQVAMVVGDPPAAADAVERLTAAKRVGLHVVLPGGVEHRGWASLELPPSRARAFDFINVPEPFFCMDSDGPTRCINRAHVRFIRPLD